MVWRWGELFVEKPSYSQQILDLECRYQKSEGSCQLKNETERKQSVLHAFRHFDNTDCYIADACDDCHTFEKPTHEHKVPFRVVHTICNHIRSIRLILKTGLTDICYCVPNELPARWHPASINVDARHKQTLPFSIETIFLYILPINYSKTHSFPTV